MPILIDGWNLIRDDRSMIRDDGNDSVDAASQLISSLGSFQRLHRDPIVLVFDSAREHLGLDHADTPALKVVASRDADSYIRRFIDGVPERQRRNLRVVSSDKEIYFYARASGAQPVKCEAFWGKLNRVNEKRRDRVQGGHHN